MKPAITRPITAAFLISVLLFIAGQLVGSLFIDNNWSFMQWPILGYTYGSIWIAVLVVSLAILYFYAPALQIPPKPSRFEWPLLGLLAVLLVAFQFDSILYGGGNLRVAQIAMSERVIYRWFELGTIAIVAGLMNITNLLPGNAATSGAWSWKVFSFACTVLTIAGATSLSRLLTTDRLKRIALTALALFGGCGIVLFGFVGIAPAVVATMMWFAVLAVRIADKHLLRDKLLVWALVLAGLLIHYSLLALLPPAVFLTLVSARTEGRSNLLAKLAATLTLIGLLVLHVLVEAHSLEYASKVLALQSRLPFTDYGIFSPRHLGDVLQLALLFSPLFLLTIPFVFLGHSVKRISSAIWSSWFLAISSLAFMMLINPTNSIVLDSPALAACFAPIGLLLALYAASLDFSDIQQRRLGLSIAAFALLVPAAYMPDYISIKRSEPYTTAYFDKQPYYYRTAVASYRDAYYARKEFSEADRWEWQWEAKSPEVLNLRGTANLAGRNEIEPALRNLYQMIARDPFWTEPRDLMAKVQTSLGRFSQASAQIDTALMLEPYGKAHFMNRYTVLRGMGKFAEALQAADRAHDYFPADIEIRTDQMLLTYRAGDLDGAARLAEELVARDSTRPYPYLIKGFAAETNGQKTDAVRQYERFMVLAPNEPETPAIRQRANRLKNPGQ